MTLESDNPCWEGYERVPNTKALTKGSCRLITKKNGKSLRRSRRIARRIARRSPRRSPRRRSTRLKK
jgi:hypothetical protein